MGIFSSNAQLNNGIKLADSVNLDSFNRLKVSNPIVLFESFFTFDLQDSRWTQSLTGSGTVTRDSNTNTANLNVTTTSGDKVVRQSRRYIPYQAGRSQHYSMSFVFNTAKTNLRQRIGCFDVNDGIFLELNNTTLSIVNRTSTSGSPSDSRSIEQASWNLDKLDGNGASGITLDITKIQLLVIEYGWQAAGSIRVGFLINGTIIYVHRFDNANSLSLPFMKRGGLPVRIEIENTGTTSGSSTCKTICFLGSSESGFNPSGVIKSASTNITSKTVSTTFTPVISIRLKSTALTNTLQILSHNILVFTNDQIEFAIVKNATLTGASFASVATDSITEVDTSATAITGGDILHKEYISTSGNITTGNSIRDSLYNSLDSHIGSLLDGTSEIITIMARVITGTGDTLGAFTWKEFP